MEYIIVHTRNGYLTHGTIADSDDYGMVPPHAFTKDIACAAVFTNYDDVVSLCDRYMASAWCRDYENAPFRPCHDPSNQFDRGIADELRRNMYAKRE